MIIGLQELLLGSLVLLVLRFKITKFTIKLVKVVFELLYLLMAILNLAHGPMDCIVTLCQHVINAQDPLFVVLCF